MSRPCIFLQVGWSALGARPLSHTRRGHSGTADVAGTVRPAVAHGHGHDCASAPGAGLFWAVNPGALPGGVSCVFEGPRTAGVQEAARSQLSVTGEGGPGLHTLRLPPAHRSPAIRVRGGLSQSRASSSPPRRDTLLSFLSLSKRHREVRSAHEILP